MDRRNLIRQRYHDRRRPRLHDPEVLDRWMGIDNRVAQHIWGYHSQLSRTVRQQKNIIPAPLDPLYGLIVGATGA